MQLVEKLEGGKKIHFTSRKFRKSKRKMRRWPKRNCVYFLRSMRWDRVPLLIILIRVFQHKTFSLLREKWSGGREARRHEERRNGEIWTQISQLASYAFVIRHIHKLFYCLPFSLSPLKDLHIENVHEKKE